MIPLPRYSRSEIEALNGIASRGAAIPFDLAGAPARLVFVPDAIPYDPAAALALRVNGSAVLLHLAEPLFAGIVERRFPGFDLIGAPEPLVAAALEAALAPLLERIEAGAGLRIAVESVAAPPRPDSGPFRLFFRLDRGGAATPVAGHLALDAAGLQTLAEAVALLPQPEQDRDEIAVAVRLEIGETRLPLGALSGLAADDLILLDSCSFVPDSVVLLRPAGGPAFRARLDGTMLTILGRGGEPMSDQDAALRRQANGESGGAAEGLDVDALELRLTFDLGETMLTVAELRALAPGYAFDLGTDLRRPVTIRASGRPIGAGELIEIDGRLGVRVVELFGTGS